MQIDYLGILSFLADLSPFILLLLNIRLIRKNTFLLLFIWTCISLTFDFFVAFSEKSFFPLIAFYSIMVETIFVGILYLTIVKKTFSKIVIYLFTLTLLIYCFYYLNKVEPKGFSNWLASVAVIYTLTLSLLTFGDIYSSNRNEFMLNDKAIWLVFAYIIYAAGNLFLFAITEDLPNIFEAAGVWIIFIISNVLKNLFFVKGIISEKKKTI